MTRFGLDRLTQALETEVEAVGLRPFARRHDVQVGVLRSILDGRDASFSNVMTIARILGVPVGPEVEDGVEQPHNATDFQIESEDFATVNRLSVEASAGPGAVNIEDEVVGSLAFRRTWLTKIGVNPARACLISVRGDSMAPGLQPDDLALIDYGRSEVAPGKVFAFNDVNGETRIKRLERPDEKSLILYSDNQAYAPELRRGVDLNRIKILGQVVWSGHNWA